LRRVARELGENMNTTMPALALLLLAVPMCTLGSRNSIRNSDEDEEEEISFFPESDEEEDIMSVQAEASDIFVVGEGGENGLVAKQNDLYEEAAITHLIEVRTKLKFKGNKMELKNPEMVPTLVSDIKEQQGQHPESKFLFCLHIGTTGDEATLTAKRPGFMAGRAKSLLDALHEEDEDLGVGAISTFDEQPFEHYQSTRFAGMVMKVYSGDNPGCAKEDLAPPAA